MCRYDIRAHIYLEGAEDPVPDDKEAPVVLVQAVAVGAVVDLSQSLIIQTDNGFANGTIARTMNSKAAISLMRSENKIAQRFVKSRN